MNLASICHKVFFFYLLFLNWVRILEGNSILNVANIVLGTENVFYQLHGPVSSYDPVSLSYILNGLKFELVKRLSIP